MARYKPRKGDHWYDALTNIRCEAGISRAELAATCEVTYAVIYDVERGSKYPPQDVLDQYWKEIDVLAVIDPSASWGGV